MSHEYHVELSNGQSYTVTSDRHHDEHPRFENYLSEIFMRTGSQVAAHMIIRYIYKGRK